VAIRQLLAAQTPETTACLVRSALWNATGSNASATLTPSKYEDILKRDRKMHGRDKIKQSLCFSVIVA
jgi:hypothetical protein